MSVDFSIILPIYNQGDQLQELYDDFSSALQDVSYTWKILFIVNGSSDNSFEQAQSICATDERFICFNLEEGGWGRAVKYGIKQAAGAHICYTNSARTRGQDLKMMLSYAVSNQDTIIKANRITRESIVRRMGSVIYNFQHRQFFKTPVWDVNGTPKVFPARFLKGMTILSNGDLIDAEIIARSFRNGFAVIEVPLLSTERRSGRSTTRLRSAYKMYKGMFELRKQLKSES